MPKPLMPMATAVWLVDNTSLSFRQIGRFCELHVLEVQAIADETVAQTIVGQDPTLSEQLTRAEIERCQNDPSADLQLVVDEVPAQPRTKGPRYTPVSKRQDKPDAIAWILRHHPEISDALIGHLIGTTKPTIEAIRSRSHWNIQNIQPKDPVSFGLCSQKDLDETVHKAQAKAAKTAKPDGSPTAQTDPPPAAQATAPATPEVQEPVAEEPAAEEPAAEELAAEELAAAEPETGEPEAAPQAAEPAAPEAAPEAKEPPAEDAPADQAVSEQPATAEAVEPVEPVEEPIEEPAAEPVEQPAEQPAEPQTAEAVEPVEPVEEPIEEPAAEPVEQPAEQSAEPQTGAGQDTKEP